MTDDDEFFDAPSETTLSCPYCGEEITVGVDVSGGAAQRYVEDCQVCCQPSMITLHFDRDGSLTAQATTLDD